MKKPQQMYDLQIPDDDYKMAAVMERDKLNFESPDKWFYVGADSRDLGFAKVGITMGDLTSRSYGTNNPNFYLFCAFQCQQSTTEAQLKSIEKSAISYLDGVFCDENGQTKRVRHMESQRLSECYYDVNFEDFFVEVHDYLLDNHVSYFQTCGFENEAGGDGGYALAWEFSSLLKPEVKRYFLNRILRG